MDHLFFVTVTGVSTPSLDARLMNRLGLPARVKRTPIFGLGCVAGAAGLARASDALRAFPGEVAVLLSVELCSLTLQREDVSMANVIATGLFGDGAAAVVLAGGDARARPGPRGRRHPLGLLPGHRVGHGLGRGRHRLQGGALGEGAARWSRSTSAPTSTPSWPRTASPRRDIRHWIAHTGGPKVLEAFRAGARRCPRRRWPAPGASLRGGRQPLLRLGALRPRRPARRGRGLARATCGLLVAMGPGFAAELVLLRW